MSSEAPYLQERALGGLHDSLMPSVARQPRDIGILDLGCGTGAWLQRLSTLGFTRLTGVDRDVKGFAAQAGRYINADLEQDDIGLGDEKFDLITAIEVIEHLDSPGRILRHAAKHLAPNGALLLTTPNIHSIPTRVKFLMTGRLRHFDAKSDPTHVAPVLLAGFERMLDRHNLRVAERWNFPERGSVATRPLLWLVGRALAAVLPEEASGDCICFRIVSNR